METTTAPTKELEPLSASDRCDACGAQAYVHYGLDTGELYFCGHHARLYSESLSGRGVVLRDETARLSETP